MNDDQKKRSCRSVQIAIDRAGSAKKLAKAAGCSFRSVYNWRDGDHVISARRAKDLAEAVDMEPADFRPDLFD
jgi:DNA-binding transcriptional regulator YdaS (Cro superfamily)